MTSELHKYMNISEKLDFTKLPFWQSQVITLISELSEAPQSAILNSFCFLTAKMTQSCRIKVRLPEENNSFPANYYGLCFMPSGSGKDSMFRYFEKNVFYQAFAKIEETNKSTYQKWIFELTKEASEKYSNERTQNQYIRDNKPRYIIEDIADGTLEGLIAARGTLKRAKIHGCTNVFISEFGRYVATEDKSREDFLTSIIDIFDHGDSKPKIIKGEKDTLPIKGVPCNFFAHSSLAGFKNEKYMERFLNKMNMGFARRSFLCFPNNEEYKPLETSFEAHIQKKKESEHRKNELKQWDDFFLKIYEHHRFSIKEYSFTPETFELFEYYKYLNKKRVQKLSEYTDDGIRAELLNRQWKALKLSGILASISHAEQKTVEALDYLQAVYITEFFGQYVKKIYAQEQTTDAEKLFNYFFENVNKEISSNDLRKQKFTNKNYFSKWLDSNFNEAVEIANNNGFNLEVLPKVRNVQKYKLTKVEIGKIKLSISHDMTTDYNPIEINFEDLHSIANSNFNYSASQYQDNYRKQSNWLGFCNVVIFDYDENITISEAKELFDDYIYLITTTKSHQKEKNELICDRFRVFLPLSEEFQGSIESYKDTFKAIDKEITNGRADQNAIEPARFYYGNPNGLHIYKTSGMLLSWSEFVPEAKTPEPAKKAQNKPSKDKYSGINDYIRKNQENLGLDQENAHVPLEDILGTAKADKAFKVDEIGEGNRNNSLHRIIKWCVDENIPRHLIKAEIERINALPNVQLPEREIQTLFTHHLR